MVSPLPFVIDLGDDQVVDLGDPVQIIPEANYSVENYLWEPSDLVDCEGECLELIWSPPYSMYIAAVGTSANKCNTSDSVFVTVNKTRKAYFPNAFSPNNDGNKDLIAGDYTGNIRIYLNTNTDANPLFNGYSYLLVNGYKFD